jgi:eukaryotic-like serine/threonine-protein kinase
MSLPAPELPTTGAPSPQSLPPKPPQKGGFFAYLISPELWITLGLVLVGGILALVILLYGIMPMFTKHGASVRVPPVVEMTYDQAKKKLANGNLEVAVLDSQYHADKPANAVLMQSPASGAKVKPGRTVYLVVNKQQPPNTRLPDVVDVNYQQAEYILSNWGIKVSKINYVPGPARDVVVGVVQGRKTLKTGDPIRQGTKVQLNVSKGTGGALVEVPDLTGRTLDEATSLLNDLNLGVGRVSYGKAPGRQADGIIYEQKPAAGGQQIEEGSEVALFVAGKAPANPEAGRNN